MYIACTKIILFLIHSSITRCIKGEPSIEEYYDMFLEAEEHREFVAEAIMQLSTTQQFLAPGRLVVVKSKSVCIHFIGLHFSVLLFCCSFLSMVYFCLLSYPMMNKNSIWLPFIKKNKDPNPTEEILKFRCLKT